MSDTISVTPLDLGAAAVLVLLLVGVTTRAGFGLGKSTLIAAMRTTVQLLLVGLVLKALFTNANLWWVLGVGLLMLLVAGREIMARQRRPFTGPWGYGLGTFSMFLSSFAVTSLALTVMIGSQP
jgi:putative ABC transport system permease protein